MPDLRKFRVLAGEAGTSLGQLLAERLEVATEQAEALVCAGAVRVDSRRQSDPSAAMKAGQRIAVHLGAAQAALSTEHFKELQILRRTRDILAVDKPAGMPSQATRWQSGDALDRLVQRIDPAARLAHRLDRETSGVVVFTRHPSAHRAMSERLATSAVERVYVALVWGNPAKDVDCLTASIGPDPHDRRRMVAGHGKPAATRYQVVARGEAFGHPVSRLRVVLETGRTHQIRVHLAHAGLPVCGDPLYGNSRAGPSRLMLHAHKISWSGEPPIEADIPAEFRELVGFGSWNE